MMYADICANEVMFRIDLFDICNTFTYMVFDDGRFLSFCIVEVSRLFITEPYNIVAINKTVADRSRCSFYHFIR